MTLTAMRYKNYVWPHNPSVYEILFKKDIVSHRVPFGTYVLQYMGREHRILRGKGEFVGPDAYNEFKRLATVFYDASPGILVHPLWDTANAYFTALHLRQEPTENYVAYNFEFWECFDGYDSKLNPIIPDTPIVTPEPERPNTRGEIYHVVIPGDALWSIASIYGISVEDIIALNPNLRNGNLMTPGSLIRVS